MNMFLISICLYKLFEVNILAGAMLFTIPGMILIGVIWRRTQNIYSDSQDDKQQQNKEQEHEQEDYPDIEAYAPVSVDESFHPPPPPPADNIMAHLLSFGMGLRGGGSSMLGYSYNHHESGHRV
ncbi:hypothetical protein AAC387_Pa11g1096 [Persea americana]